MAAILISQPIQVRSSQNFKETLLGWRSYFEKMLAIHHKEGFLKVSRRLDLNWPRKLRVEISMKFVTKGSRRGGKAQILKKDFKKLENLTEREESYFVMV